jgi:hypothetical protein
MILKYPPSVGVSWESGTIWGSNQIVTEETLSTAIGSVPCRKVSYAAAPGSWHFRWFAQDIGIVRDSQGYGGVTTSSITREIYNKNF